LYLNEAVNVTEPSPSAGVPCRMLHFVYYF
jgi:hypothetical protein